MRKTFLVEKAAQNAKTLSWCTITFHFASEKEAVVQFVILLTGGRVYWSIMKPLEHTMNAPFVKKSGYFLLVFFFYFSIKILFAWWLTYLATAVLNFLISLCIFCLFQLLLLMLFSFALLYCFFVCFLWNQNAPLNLTLINRTIRTTRASCIFAAGSSNSQSIF